MTPVEWLALLMLLISGLALGAAVTVSNGQVARAVNKLEQTYRKEKARLQEEKHAAEMARYGELLQQQLRADPTNGWKPVALKLMQRAFETTRQPALALAGSDPAWIEISFQDGGASLVLTPQPRRLVEAGLLGKRNLAQLTPIDAALYPEARLDVALLWHTLLQADPGLHPWEAESAPWYAAMRAAPRLIVKQKA